MTVKELKELLSEYDEDMEVKYTPESGIWKPITWVCVKSHDIYSLNQIETIKFVGIQ